MFSPVVWVVYVNIDKKNCSRQFMFRVGGPCVVQQCLHYEGQWTDGEIHTFNENN